MVITMGMMLHKMRVGVEEMSLKLTNGSLSPYRAELNLEVLLIVVFIFITIAKNLINDLTEI
jgi:hypothetical protein